MQYKNPQETNKRKQKPELVELSESCFAGSSGTEEYQFILKPLQYGRLSDQLDSLEAGLADALERRGLSITNVIFKRFFCDDLENHIGEICKHPFSDPAFNDNGIVSHVTQPPQSPAKIALWAYCINDVDSECVVQKDGNSLILKRGEQDHIWTTGLAFPEFRGSHAQTHAILNKYNAFLNSRGMTLSGNCVRTWFFVKNIDTNYNGMVVARNEVFTECGLTKDTHYIASTGIEGSSADAAALILLDAYAISNLHPKQIQYLQALDHLSPTHVYGVAFERASSIDYADRKHIFISGTASIDQNGQIVHAGDLLCQLDRTLENIQALLSEADASLEDMQQCIVYLRDSSDVEIIHDVLKERIGDIPFLVVTAPVCRPSWLVEIEGIAVVQNSDHDMPEF